MAWKTTRRFIDGDRLVATKGADAATLTDKFRLYDDDGNCYFEGIATKDTDFAPLDDYGIAFGCTEIRYWEKFQGQWSWRTL